ncbi:MAG: Sensor kinase CckA [Calditrichaeota bacterium]|nr:Sensor kinase CckA [Calditrichota bacterium]
MTRLLRRTLGEHILVIEDNEMVRKSSVRSLQRYGYRVEQASSAPEALELLRSGTVEPDLILTDVIMPRMSGVEFADELARLGARYPILFMSGYPRETVVQQGILQQDRPYLQKPFKPAKLAERVREVLDSPSPPGTARA